MTDDQIDGLIFVLGPLVIFVILVFIIRRQCQKEEAELGDKAFDTHKEQVKPRRPSIDDYL